MIIQDALRIGIQQLQRHSSTPHLDTEILLSHVLQKSKTFLSSYPEYSLGNVSLRRYFRLLERRKKGEPIAYIIGEKAFYHLQFFVNANVLIPRPETEVLIEIVSSYIANEIPDQKKVTLADIGTGSGCIAVTLAKLFPHLNIFATDISTSALSLAKKNALYHKTHNIQFFTSNLLKNIGNLPIHVFVANLPYLDPKEKYSKEISYEPPLALFSGDRGRALYYRFFSEVSHLKFLPRAVFCEIHPVHASFWKKFLPAILPQYTLEFHLDYQGAKRFLSLKM